MTLIAVEARVRLVSGVRRATHPGKTGLLAIETITGGAGVDPRRTTPPRHRDHQAPRQGADRR
jgi:hypothetical protein